jgi:streptogramin lyase
MTGRSIRRTTRLSLLVVLAVTTACTQGTTTATGSPDASSATSPDQVGALHPVETIDIRGPEDLEIAFGDIWVTNESLDAVTRIDGATFEPRSIPLGAGFSPQEVEPFAGSMWVSGVGGLIRLDPATGRLQTFHRGLTKALAVGFGTLLVGGYGHVDRVDPSTGEITATFDAATKELCWPSVADGSIWVSCGGTVRRIDPATNGVVSTIIGDGRALRTVGALILGAHGTLWLATSRDIYSVADSQDAYMRLDRIDPATDRIEPGTKIMLARGTSSHFPCVVGDHIWFPIGVGVGPDVGKLIEFDPVAGEILQTFDLSEQAARGYNSIGFAYGSAWTASFPLNRVARWVLPLS